MQLLSRCTMSLAAGLLFAASASAQDPNAVANGAVVYGRSCARCHNLRAPSERSDREWRVIVSHMRSRANLTRDDARSVLAFLRATNGDDVPASASVNATHGVTATTLSTAPTAQRVQAYQANVQEQAKEHPDLWQRKPGVFIDPSAEPSTDGMCFNLERQHYSALGYHRSPVPIHLSPASIR